MPDNDLIDRLADLSPGDALHAVRHQRARVVAATQASYEALFDPALPALHLGERLLVALQVCRRTPAPELAMHYRALLRESGTGMPMIDPRLVSVVDGGNDEQWSRWPEPRLRAILKFAQVLTDNPIAGDKRLLQSLPASGFTTAATIALAQLIGFLSYQTRLLAGLRAMRSLATGATAPATAAPEATALEATAYEPATRESAAQAVLPIRIKGFSNETFGWQAWLDVVDLTTASGEQIAVIEESHPQAKTSDYYRLLVHQPHILRERSRAFNAIMYAPGGQPRAERELAATVTSRINGCVYCASVHAQRFEQLAKRNDTIAQVFDEPAGAGTTARERAIVAFSIALTRAPHRVDAAAIAPLKAVGLNNLELLDLFHSVAIFAWANRLMLNLGEPVAPVRPTIAAAPLAP